MITIMKINYERGCVADNVTDHMIAKHFELVLHWSQCLQDLTPKFYAENHSKFFMNKSKQPDRWPYPRHRANRHLLTHATGWI